MLLTGVAVSIARCGREKEINAQVMAAKEEQTRQELRMQQEYGCDIYGQYEYPYNTMSQDWSGDQVEGFYYHEITEECKKAGGQFPVIMQVYTYIICEQNDVDYEMEEQDQTKNQATAERRQTAWKERQRLVWTRWMS